MQQHGAQWASAEPVATRASRSHRRPARLAALIAVLVALAAGAVIPNPTRAASSPAHLKAVIIVGPTHGETGRYLKMGEAFARSAQAQGMDVRRVFHPNATWERVLANIQGASLVVYLGHGNGWPSPYAPYQTRTKNGFGLNPVAGGPASSVKYYGEGPIGNSIRLAPNAIVVLSHACYSAGNGETGQAIPSESLARQRVDNFAAGFLRARARTVFAFYWKQSMDFTRALFTKHVTMDQLFMTRGTGAWDGYAGGRDVRFASSRTPGARVHLDRNRSEGWLRAVSGDLTMTTDEWRGSPAPSSAAKPEAPVLSNVAGSVDGGLPVRAGRGAIAVSPNGDGTRDTLTIHHTLSQKGRVAITVTNDSGKRVRSLVRSLGAGATTTPWNGRNDAGSRLPDGRYRVAVAALDSSGNRGRAAILGVRLVTALRAPTASRRTLFARDHDQLAQTVTLRARLDKSAYVTWQIVDREGTVVRSRLRDARTPAGQLSWVWDGKDARGRDVPDGWYRAVIKARTSAGTAAYRTPLYAAAFRLYPKATSATRGGKFSLVAVSTEPLRGTPRLVVTQPGVAPYTVIGKRYSATNFKFDFRVKAAGRLGKARLQVVGTDVGGQRQRTLGTLTLMRR